MTAKPSTATTLSSLGVMVVTSLVQYYTVTQPAQNVKAKNKEAVSIFAIRAKECLIAKDLLYERLIDEN